MAQPTQDFINEIASPSHASHAQRLTMLRALSNQLRQNKQQIARLHGLLQDAELTEGDENLRGRFESLFQTLGAMNRQLGNVADEARRLHAASRELENLYADLGPVAQALGYTTP